jgi:ribonuclease BN (tRNA processing enzyme)
VDHKSQDSAMVYERGGLRVTAMGVPHGIVPSISYRVDVAGKSIVFGSDQNGSSEDFAGFAGKADVLVAHMAIPERAGKGARSLHATPSEIGKMATGAGVSSLMLSHFMARSLRTLDQNLDFVGQKFREKVVVAEDLLCFVP